MRPSPRSVSLNHLIDGMADAFVKYVAWISQLGLNYTRLDNINGTSGTTIQPGGNLWFNGTEYKGDPAVNGTSTQHFHTFTRSPY